MISLFADFVSSTESTDKSEFSSDIHRESSQVKSLLFSHVIPSGVCFFGGGGEGVDGLLTGTLSFLKTSFELIELGQLKRHLV